MTLMVPTLVNGSETRDYNRIQEVEMMFLRVVKGCRRCTMWGCTRDLDIFSMNKNINEYREKWRVHMNRMIKNKEEDSKTNTKSPWVRKIRIKKTFEMMAVNEAATPIGTEMTIWTNKEITSIQAIDMSLRKIDTRWIILKWRRNYDVYAVNMTRWTHRQRILNSDDIIQKGA